MNYGKRITDALLLALIFAAPLLRPRRIMFDGVFLSKELFIQFMAGLVLIAFLLRFNSEDEIRRGATPIDVPIYIFFAACVLSAVFAAAKFLALQSMIFTAAGFFLFYVAARHFDSYEQIERLLWATAASALAVSALGLFQIYGICLNGFAGLRLITFKNGVTTTLGGANLTAQFLMPAVILCVALAFLKPLRTGWVSLAAGAFIFLIFLFTISRGAYIGLAAGFIVSSCFILAGRRTLFDSEDARRLKIAAAAFAVVLTVFVSAALFIVRGDIGARAVRPAHGTAAAGDGESAATRGMLSIMEQTTDSFKLRVSWWKDALGMIRDNPVIGVGPGNFEVAHFKYRSVSESDIPAHTRVTSPHSDLLHTWSETGIAGIGAFAAIILILFGKMAKRVKSLDRNGAIIYAGLAGALAATLAQGAIDFNLHNPVPSLLFWALAGVAFCPALYDSPREKTPMNFRFEAARYSLMAAAVLIVVFTAAGFKHEIHVMNGIRRVQSGKADEGEKEYMKALALQPGDFKTYIFLGRLYEEAGDYSRAARFMEEGIRRYPNYYSFIDNLGQIYFSAGNYGRAEEQYSRALRIYPKYSQSHYGLAFVYAETGRTAPAEDEIAKGFDLSVKSAWDWNLLGALRLKLRDYGKAFEYLETAVEMDPENPYILYNFSYACYYTGKKSEAISTLHKAMSLKPDEPEFNKMMRRFMSGSSRIPEKEGFAGA